MTNQQNINYKNYRVEVELVNGKKDFYNVTDTNRINASKQIAVYLQKRNIPYNKIESKLLNHVPIVVPPQ